jgi:hypothetical protein
VSEREQVREREREKERERERERNCEVERQLFQENNIVPFEIASPSN